MIAEDLQRYPQDSRDSIVSTLDAPASVRWWPEPRRQTTFGQCDIVRELIDGRSGADNPEGYYDLVLSMASAPTTGPGTSSKNA
jgi:hypothetical protein